MDKHARPERASSKRSALTEIQPRSRASQPNSKTAIGSTSRLPHHESLNPECNLSIRERSQARSSIHVDKRASIIVNESSPANKRDSQVSTTSTASGTKGKRKTHIGPWQLGKTLGKGATGRVRLAKHALTGQTAAIKIVSKKSAAMVQSASMAQMDKDEAHSVSGVSSRTMPFGIEREIVIMKLIAHPNVTTLYDIWENRGELYLVLEYVEGGELFDYVSCNGALPESEAVRLFRQIIAGLSYCHRFHICHRDLKPENILLDKQRNIKLADFGMAALQPIDKYLTTSCGSPHYAAPEIILGKQYRGDRADIWSVGIILFAMLNGFLPFDGGDLSSTLRLVKKGDYYLPPTLSAEASDLIQRILQKRPEKRISMDEIWRHPLIKKYEKLHATLAAPAKLIGAPPPLTSEDCGPRRLRRIEIDKELLRNLQTLWHGEKQEELIKRLLSEEPNHEKLFYWALVKFRDEQLENYSGEPLQYSSSDYHHANRPHTTTKFSGKTLSSGSRYSQFSILSGESKKKETYYKNPTVAASKTTQSSYDPYRSSRTPVVHGKNQATIVVPQSNVSRAKSMNKAGSQIQPVDRSKIASNSVRTYDSEYLEEILRQKRATLSTLSSRNTLSSYQRGMRNSTSYKRNVSFQYRRKKSASTSGKKSTVHQQKPAKDVESDRTSYITNQSIPDSKTTPSLPNSTNVSGPRRPASDLDLQKTRGSYSHWREETRKVSAELGKICEQAFNRTSISSMSEASQRMIVDSPATTVSIPQNLLQKPLGSRPLPMTPVLQELIERRQNIINTWGDADPKTLADIVDTLDRRIVEEQCLQSTADQRAVSDPTTNKTKHVESVRNTMDDLTRNRDKDIRAASDPVRGPVNTIRLVSPDPSSPIARLEARKNKVMPINSLKGGPIETTQDRSPRTLQESRFYDNKNLEPIEESPKPFGTNTETEPPSSKRWAWLSKRSHSSQEDLPPTPPRKNSPPKGQMKSIQATSDSSANTIQHVQHVQNEADAVVEKKQKWFKKMFGKSNKKSGVATIHEHKVLDENDEDTDSGDNMGPHESVVSHFGRTRYQPATSVEAAAAVALNGPIEVNQNWFAKFFHLKPASANIVLQMTKVRARKEITRILREWKKFGLQDVIVEKGAGGDVVRGRVDIANYLHIKPVSFFANFYIVLERNRRTNLSIAKFTQEKGAASSFYRVVETLESVLNERDLMLTDKTRRKAILKSMKESGL